MLNNFRTENERPTASDRLIGLLDRFLRPRNQPHIPQPGDIQRIVVIKPCCLGDMLMATPVLRALTREYPDSTVTIVTSEWTQPAIETSPRIEHLIRYPDGHPVLAAFQVARVMRTFRFDLGVSLDRSPATSLALRIAGIPIRLGIDSHSRGLGLTHRVTPGERQHETDLYLSTLRALGISDQTREPEYAVPDQVISRVSELIPVNRDRKLVVIHPGGAVNPGVAMLEKRWPATNFGELARILAQEANTTIAIVGAESDRNAVETVREFARVPVIDLCGQLSLPELAALCKQASLYIGNDSGTTHLASAVSTPVVAIFGPTNPHRYAPLGRRTRICAPAESWELSDSTDLRLVDRSKLPDIATVPLPNVLNACLELLGSSA
jgi:heptosyltransferase II